MNYWMTRAREGYVDYWMTRVGGVSELLDDAEVYDLRVTCILWNNDYSGSLLLLLILITPYKRSIGSDRMSKNVNG